MQVRVKGNNTTNMPGLMNWLKLVWQSPTDRPIAIDILTNSKLLEAEITQLLTEEIDYTEDGDDIVFESKFRD